MAFSTNELVPGLAAEIADIDLRERLSADEFDALHAAWMAYPVLRFRGQSLSDDELMAFSERFGTLDHAPVGKLQPGDDPNKITKITVISNIVENGRHVGALGAGEAEWHTDISYVDKPAKASALYALEVPPTGGDTHFCNMYGAFDRLPATLRERLPGLKIKHNSAHTSVGDLRRGFEPITEPRQAPGALHPIIRTHPDSGRSALFLGRRMLADVPSLPSDESEALLDALWEYVAQDGDVWTQQWLVGDVVLWDNRAVMHRRAAFDASARRRMHRTQICGDVPFE